MATTIVNTPTPTNNANNPDPSGNAVTLIVVAILVIILLMIIYYGIPALRSGFFSKTPSVQIPSQINVNINKK